MHPQTVPRGFLRLYLLFLLSRRPESGYSMMQTIAERTEGAWRPGPGTIYPLLKSMVREGLVEPLGSGKEKGSVTYSVTEKGTEELEEMQRNLGMAGRN